MQSQQHLRAHGNPVTHRVLIRLAAPALALAIALTGSGPGRAQTANATLNGTILDATGATVPGAKITLTNTQTAAIYSNLSESDGRYSVLNLTPGSYTVEVSKEGFSTIKRLDQQFFVGQTV